MTNLDKCKQIIDTESGRVLLYRDEVEAVLTAGDTISRRQAIDALRMCQTYLFYTHDPDPKISLESAEYEIEQLPSAQLEVIRCKDCKHWGKRGLCKKWDYYISNEDFYCGCVERRTDE